MPASTLISAAPIMAHKSEPYVNALRQWLSCDDSRTQQDIADKLSSGTTVYRQGTVNRWLTGIRNPNAEVCARIAEVFSDFLPGGSNYRSAASHPSSTAAYSSSSYEMRDPGPDDARSARPWTDSKSDPWNRTKPEQIRNTSELRAWMMTILLNRGLSVEQACNLAGYDNHAAIEKLVYGTTKFAYWRPDRLRSFIERGLGREIEEAPVSEDELIELGRIERPEGPLKRSVPVLNLAAAVDCPTIADVLALPPTLWEHSAPTDGRTYVCVPVPSPQPVDAPHGSYLRCVVGVRPEPKSIVVCRYRDAQDEPHVVIRHYIPNGNSVNLVGNSVRDFIEVETAQIDWLLPVDIIIPEYSVSISDKPIR